MIHKGWLVAAFNVGVAVAFMIVGLCNAWVMPTPPSKGEVEDLRQEVKWARQQQLIDRDNADRWNKIHLGNHVAQNEMLLKALPPTHKTIDRTAAPAEIPQITTAPGDFIPKQNLPEE